MTSHPADGPAADGGPVTRSGDGPRVTLFCCPPAGGGPSTFHDWPAALAPSIEVSPLLLPGRHPRAHEAACTDLQALAELLAGEMLARLDRPYALYGHSMGALLAFELTRALRRAGAPEPVALYASAFRAPQVAHRGPPIHMQSDQRFVEELRKVADVSQHVLDDAELRELVLPVLRADVALCESYRYVAGPPLACPVRIFGGDRDSSVTRAELDAWRVQTTAAFRVEMFPGDHGFPRTARPAVLDALCRDLVGLAGGTFADVRLREEAARPPRSGSPGSGERSAYWTQQLDGAEGLELVSADLGKAGPGILRFEIPVGVATALDEWNDGIHDLMLAALAILLARLSGRDEIVVGIPSMGRSSDWLPIRIAVPGASTFSDLVERVPRLVLDANEHAPVPFAPDVWHPLIHAAFTCREEGLSTDCAVGGTFDLSLDLGRSGRTWRGRLAFNGEGLDRPTAARLVGSFVTLLGAIAVDPDVPARDLPLLCDEDRQTVLVRWNDTASQDDDERDVLTRFEAVVDATPSVVAFIDGSGPLTYAELDRRANQLALHLSQLGVGPEVPVGVCLDRSSDIPSTLLAVWKAGGAWLPLDPGYPPDRLRFMLQDAGAPVLVTTSDLSQLFGERFSGHTVLLDREASGIATCSDDRPGHRPDPRQLASITYTSGSTGRPKGVAVEHDQILNRLAWMWSVHPFEGDEVGAQVTPTSFVDAMWELLGALLCGVPTVIVAPGDVRDLGRFVDAMAAARVTRLWLVPSILRALLDTHPDLASRLPQLRFWVCTGETLPLELYERFGRSLPQATLYNLYGTSEVWDATWYDPHTHGAPQGRVPVGRPIRNVRTYVLDRWRQAVPPGFVGELYVGGRGVARGYLNLPQLTAERFVPDPFDGDPGTRMYRTGDLARHRPDGALELLGRSDRQVSIRGIRIEPAEVEAHLAAHPAVAEAAVTAVPEEGDGRRLVAYIVPTNAVTPTTGELRDHLARRLPSPSIPGVFVVLEAVPHTPSGKIDHGSLPAGDALLTMRHTASRAPQTHLERAVAAIWRDVLHEDDIGLDDDFFTLGGHSLSAIELVSQVRARFGVEFPVRRLFDAPTVAGMTRSLRGETS